MTAALEMTRARATSAGLELTTIEADITEWEPTDKFDLVLDHGLLHNMNPDCYPLYREHVMQAVADDGEFVILHWLKRTPDKPQSKIGPTRVSREDIQKFFSPELKERFFAVEEIVGLAESVGASMAQGYYWFKRTSTDCL
jgi:cyclopropane fatty-acyl-phospholipid synthase-like methyltransferase